MPLYLQFFFAVTALFAWTGFVYASGRLAGCQQARLELEAEQITREIERDPRRLRTDRQLPA